MIGTPSLELMTQTALKILAKDEKGFFLMVFIIAKILIKLINRHNHFTF